MVLLLWPNQNFSPRILENEFNADEPPLRMKRFGPEICETSVLCNATVTMLAILHLSVVEKQQVITVTRKMSALPVTLSWLLPQHGVGKKHIVSIHPRLYPSQPMWNRWGQSIKLQVSVTYTFARKTRFWKLFPQWTSEQHFFCCWTWLCFIWKYQPQWASSEIPEWNNSRRRVERREGIQCYRKENCSFPISSWTRVHWHCDQLVFQSACKESHLICWWAQAKPSCSLSSLA